MPTPEKLTRWAGDPLAFAEDLTLPTPRGDMRFGDVMADFQRERFAKLAPDLVALQRREQPPIGRHWWEATKKASKDTDLAVATLWLIAFSARPMYGQIGAADQDQAGELRKAAMTILWANPWIGNEAKVRGDKWKIESERTGAVIEIVAADRRGSHGARPDFLVINELHAISDGNLEFAQNLMDNADGVPTGVRVIATNAGFTGTWQWRWREASRTSERWYFHQRTRPAPWISEADLADSKKRNSASRYQRLWAGVWVPKTGDAIDPADVEASLTLSGPQERAQPGWIYAAGLDLGVKRDHSALVVVGTCVGTGRIAVVQVQSWQPGLSGRVDLREVREAVLAAAMKFRPCMVRYDPSQAELMAQELTAAGVPMVEQIFAGRQLDTMATTLMEVFRSRSLDMYQDRALLDDLYRLTIEERRFGYKLTSASDDAGHADRAIALAVILPDMAEIAATAVGTGDEIPLPSCVIC